MILKVVALIAIKSLMENHARVTWIILTLRTTGLIAALGISNRTSTDNQISASSLWVVRVSYDISFCCTTSLFNKNETCDIK